MYNQLLAACAAITARRNRIAPESRGDAQRGRAARLRGCPAAVMLACIAPAVLAQGFDTAGVAGIADRVRAGEHQAAYDRALERRAELEGQPEFDFWYGIAALETGHVNEAIFALERVLLAQPGSARVRLELARAHFLAGEDRRARRHFEQVLAQDPPGPVTATVERYLHAIRQRADRYTTVVTGYAEVGGGHDTNVNSATDANEIDMFGISFELSDEDREKGDEFARFGTGAEVRRPLSPDTTFFLAGDFEQRANAEHNDFDTRKLEARAGTVLHHDQAQTRLGLRAQQFDVGGEPYRDLLGIDLNANWRPSPGLVFHGGLQLAQQTYEDQELRDATLAIISGGLTGVEDAPLRPVVSVGAFVGREEPDDDSDNARAIAERDIAGLSGSLRLQFTPQWRLRAGLQYRRNEYGADHILTQKTRKEDYYQAELALNWQPDTHWRVGPQLRYSVNEANVELYDYERSVFELRARYGF